MSTVFFVYLLSSVLVILVMAIAYVYYKSRRRGMDSLNLVLLLIKIPRAKQEDEEKTDGGVLSQINLSEQLFSAVSAIEKPVAFEISVNHSDEQIYFYTAVPRENADFIARQIQGFFPTAVVEEVEDYNIFGQNSAAAGAYLSLGESFMLPIRSYKEAEVDTFSPIISTLSKLAEVGEGASIQIVMRPAGSSIKKFIVSAIEKLKKGEKLKDVLKMGTLANIAKEFKKSILEDNKKKDEIGSPKIIDDEAVKALQLKTSKQLFSVNVRAIASAPTKDRAEDILLSMVGSFSQFTAPMRNQLKVIKVNSKQLKKLLYDFSFREYDVDNRIVLNAEELASIFHLPTKTTDVPRVKWLRSKEAPPPENLPKEGTTVGESIFRGDKRLVKITDDDRRRHLYIIGQTGTGKSVLMLNQMIQDIRGGKGVCLIDPHGELVDMVLERVPKERINDVIVFDPGDIARPVGLNMLEYNFSNPQEKTFIVNEIQAIFNRLFSKESMGPIFEQYMRNTLLLLMEDAKNEPATMMEVPRVFIDDEYRERKLARINSPTVIDFWEKEAAKMTGEHSLANMAAYITSKFDNFIANDYMRPIIGQTKSAFNFRKVMDEGKILLVNLSKGKIGDINSDLLGMIFTGKILMSALSRVDQDPSKRKDFFLYIDEFHNYTTDSIAVILSEARKYRLNLTLAHQFIEQLEDDIRDSVFGNVGSLVSFRVGVTDSEFLVKQFEPEFSANDLISMENRCCAAKLLINGVPSRPFNMKTLNFEPGNTVVRDKLKELSRLTYGRELDDVEKEIFARLRL